MKIIIAIFIFQITFIGGNAQSKISIALSIKDSIISCKKDNLIVSYKIINNTTVNLKIPNPVVLLNDNYAADLMYTIEKYNDSTKDFLPYRYLISEIAYREVKFQFLKPKKCIFNTEHMPCIFFDKGLFRMRLKLFSNRYNKAMTDFYSDWVKFTIVETYSIK